MSDFLWPKKQYTSFTGAKPAKYETVLHYMKTQAVQQVMQEHNRRSLPRCE